MISCYDQRLSRTGWRPEETERLFQLADAAQAAGSPLKSVFDAVAAETGRRPNSVRNYYYARIKESGDPALAGRRAFEPFSGEEAALLMEEVLASQARGESVRSCTLRLAGGNDKSMLRYQNKYRSMLKNNPELVRRVREDMQRRGVAAADPYAEPVGRRAGRPRKTTEQGRSQGYERVLRDLSKVEGLDVRALMDALGALALSAMKGTRPENAIQKEEAASLRAENENLRGQIARQNERYRVMLGYLTRLTRINSEFLSLNSVVKVSNLSSYIRDLESNVRSCRQLVEESAN